MVLHGHKGAAEIAIFTPLHGAVGEDLGELDDALFPVQPPGPILFIRFSIPYYGYSKNVLEKDTANMQKKWINFMNH